MNHVTIKNVEGGHLMQCAHCGDSYLLRPPMPLYLFASNCKAYAERHEECEERKADGRD